MFKRKKKNIKVGKNQMRVEEAPPKLKAKKVRKVRKRVLRDRGFAKAVQSVMDGSILTKEIVLRLLPFTLFLTFIAVIYIANSYYAEKKIIETERVNTEINELRYEYITTKSELMYYSKQSEVVKKLQEKGIKESVTPPIQINR
ncbi:MAG: hypothetical protein K9J13_02475 [Saprospiraceae bacterium]|nr:hypothetical protein [Saprospiraceae bacterium]